MVVKDVISVIAVAEVVLIDVIDVVDVVNMIDMVEKEKEWYMIEVKISCNYAKYLAASLSIVVSSKFFFSATGNWSISVISLWIKSDCFFLLSLLITLLRIFFSILLIVNIYLF